VDAANKSSDSFSEIKKLGSKSLKFSEKLLKFFESFEDSVIHINGEIKAFEQDSVSNIFHFKENFENSQKLSHNTGDLRRISEEILKLTGDVAKIDYNVDFAETPQGEELVEVSDEILSGTEPQSLEESDQEAEQTEKIDEAV
jgi:hypothetical protein